MILLPKVRVLPDSASTTITTKIIEPFGVTSNDAVNPDLRKCSTS